MSSKELSPAEDFNSIIARIRLISALVGADIAKANYRVNLLTLLVITCITIYFIFSVTTIIDMFEEDWTFMLEASCMLGSVLQGVTKLITGILYTKRLYSIRVQLEHLYAEYEIKGGAYYKVLQQSCERQWKLIKFVGFLYATTLVGVVMLPIGVLLISGTRNLIMHFVIPGLDIKTDFGYYTTMCVHVVVMCAGVFGLYAGDLFFLVYLTQPLLLLDIMKLKIKEMNVVIDENTEDIRKMLNDIIKWHQFYTEYNEECNGIFFYIVTMQIATSGISILCTLYILVAGDWLGVYVYLPVTFSALYLFCIMGTRIETCNEGVCEEIYNINWYKLKTSERKMLVIMLMKSQQPADIKVGGVLPLSVTTALSITKTLYGIFTMMLRYVGE